VCRLLRNTPGIDRIVYVSCNADAFVSNALSCVLFWTCLAGVGGLMRERVCSLCRPVSRKQPGAPFRPVRAAGVDMFPHTGLCELVVLLERVPEAAAAAAAAAVPIAVEQAESAAAEATVSGQSGDAAMTDAAAPS
jgi:tRNA (uracil-5-)-methyltransferase